MSKRSAHRASVVTSLAVTVVSLGSVIFQFAESLFGRDVLNGAWTRFFDYVTLHGDTIIEVVQGALVAISVGILANYYSSAERTEKEAKPDKDITE